MRDALCRFAAGQDLRDRALFESAFTEDATLDFTRPARALGAEIPLFEGRSAIVDTILAAVAPLDTTHTLTNLRVLSYAGDRAEVSALIEAQHLARDDHGRRLLLKNQLTVELARQGALWAIRRMRFDNRWLEGDPAVLFPG